MKDNIEISYASGMLHGRVADVDTSSGVSEITAGVEYRCRVSKIVECWAEGPGVIALVIEGKEDSDPMPLIGSMKGFDNVMKRAEMREDK